MTAASNATSGRLFRITGTTVGWTDRETSPPPTRRAQPGDGTVAERSDDLAEHCRRPVDADWTERAGQDHEADRARPETHQDQATEAAPSDLRADRRHLKAPDDGRGPGRLEPPGSGNDERQREGEGRHRGAHRCFPL